MPPDDDRCDWIEIIAGREDGIGALRWFLFLYCHDGTETCVGDYADEVEAVSAAYSWGVFVATDRRGSRAH